MTKLTFYTPTTLDEAFIFTMGASVKKSNNPIGFFGTGLKYAIAVTLRLGGTISIETNERKYLFTTNDIELRGEKMTMIDCRMFEKNSDQFRIHRCPMTTDYGKTWEPWMVMRELWSNTQDEKGQVWANDEATPVLYNEYTLITVDCPSVYDAWLTRDKYLLNPLRRPLFENDLVQMFQGRTDSLFYRGICVSSTPVQAGFTYNFKTLSGYRLTEDRTIDGSSVRGLIVHTMAQCTDRALLDAWFDRACVMESYESSMPFTSWDLVKETTQEYADAACEAVNRNLIFSPTGLKEVVYQYRKNHDPESVFKPCDITKEDGERFATCLAILEKAGFKFGPYKIYFTKDMAPSHYGSAYGRTKIIVLNYLWTVNHDNWQKQTCMTLIEEYVHLVHEVRDNTREMQEAYNEIIYYIAANGKI